MTPFMTSEDVMLGGEAGGAYLNTIKKTDLARLTGDEWRTFLSVVVNGANRAAGERIVGAWIVPMGDAG